MGCTEATEARDDVIGLATGRACTTGIRCAAIDVSIKAIVKVSVQISVVECFEEVEPELEAQFLAPHPPVLVDRKVCAHIGRTAAGFKVTQRKGSPHEAAFRFRGRVSCKVITRTMIQAPQQGIERVSLIARWTTTHSRPSALAVHA
jgi:hypothetical protein